MNYFIEDDLFKAMHKYIKRTGSKGSYKYWYKLPDGRIVAQDDHQEHGKVDHLKRLIAGRMRGVHTKTNEQIAEEVGVDKVKVGQHERNMRRPTSTTHNDYHESHLKEASTDVNHESYQGHAREVENQHDSGAAPARVRGARTGESREAAPAATTSTRSARSSARSSSRRESSATREEPAREGNRGGRQESNQEQQAHQDQSQSEAERRAAAIQAKRQEVKNLFGIDLGSGESGSTSNRESGPVTSFGEGEGPRTESYKDHTIERVGTPASGVTYRVTAPNGTLQSTEYDSIERAKRAIDTEAQISANVARANEKLAQARESERRAREATARAESSPDQPHAREMAAADPTFGRDEAEISSMIAEQRAGGNPYLTKAKDVFERIQNNVKPERRATVGHVLSAISNLKEENKPLNDANIIAEYKRLSGKNIRSINGIAEEFEKATFFTLKEVTDNEPINAEVERMKRGYAAKQFARCKPFLKPEWMQAHIGAPPPMPTFGDFKSWSEHGGPKPDWAGTTRLAVPREVFEAAPKGADGKPKYPPAWMPLHLMPVWNYAYKRMGTDDAYQATGTGISINSNSPTGFNLNMGDQAQYQEGVIKASIRKYVQMRGGADQLTDIPKSKLAEAGLTHADIYKSEDDIESILKTKIIDPVALVPYIDAEMANKVKKSVVFVVDSDAIFKSQKALREEEILKKAELINKIKKAKMQYVVRSQK